MAEHNYTKYDSRNGNGILNRECMMGIRNLNNIIDIYIPFDWLNKNIKEEDVYRWIEIGNKLIFPATIEKSFIKNTSLYNDNENTISLFNGLKIKGKTSKSNYIQSDATLIKCGLLINISIHNDIYSIRLDEYHNDSFDEIKYSSWNGYSPDYELSETGECLDAYIKRKLKEQSTEEQPGFNSYKISIDCSKALSNHHKLAILSFYRFLWSNLYKGIVLNTLKIVDSGVDPWDALYYAMSTKDYFYYYGLISRPGYRSMDFVVKDLKNANNINTSFSCKQTDVIHTIMSVDDFVCAVESFKSKSLSMNPDAAVRVKYVSDKLKSFSKNKIYDAIETYDKNKWLIFYNDNYCKMTVLKKHFEKI